MRTRFGDRHLGFSPAQLDTLLRSAGLTDVRVDVGARKKLDPFTVLLASQMRHAERPPCMCFGGASQRPIGARDIVRNVSLLVLVLIAIVP